MSNLKEILLFIHCILGDNFLGIVYRIHYSAQYEKDKSRLILKVAPSDYTRRGMFHIRECFLHEIYVYEEVDPNLYSNI